MTTITKESLTDKIALLELIQRDDYITQEELFQLEAYRMLLAGMEQEPVTIPKHITKISEATLDNILANDDEFPMANAARLLVREVRFWRQQPLYAAPQPLTDAERAELEQYRKAAAQSVPHAIVTDEEEMECNDGWADSFRGGWNACRAAMLQAGNSPVIPDGWVMVPVEPTEDMIIHGFESEPGEFFSRTEEWEAYQEMSGCQQAAHRATLCWAAMVAASPKKEC
jgi:hypothetical protein